MLRLPLAILPFLSAVHSLHNAKALEPKHLGFRSSTACWTTPSATTHSVSCVGQRVCFAHCEASLITKQGMIRPSRRGKNAAAGCAALFRRSDRNRVSRPSPAVENRDSVFVFQWSAVYVIAGHKGHPSAVKKRRRFISSLFVNFSNLKGSISIRRGVCLSLLPWGAAST